MHRCRTKEYAKHQIKPAYAIHGTCCPVDETYDTLQKLIVEFYESTKDLDDPYPFSIRLKPRGKSAALAVALRIDKILRTLQEECIPLRFRWWYWGPGKAGSASLIIGIEWQGLAELAGLGEDDPEEMFDW